jgi:serine protease Do
MNWARFRQTSALCLATTVGAWIVAAPVLAQTAEALYGDIAIAAGSAGPIATVPLDAGGADDASVYGAGCIGFINAAQPDLTLTLDGPVTQLRVGVRSGSDTTLLVLRPDGSAICNDDSDGLNPAVDIPKAMAGTYSVWVGVIEATITTAEVDITAGAAGTGGIAAPTPEAAPPVDRSLPLEAVAGRAAEARGRAVLASIEEARQAIEVEAGSPVLLETSRPVAALESGAGTRIEFPDLVLDLEDIRLEFGTVVLNAEPGSGNETAWELIAPPRIAVTENGAQVGEIVWADARITWRHDEALQAITGTDIDVREIALRAVDDPSSFSIGRMRLSSDLVADANGRYGGPGLFEMNDIAVDSEAGRLRITRFGFETRSEGADLGAVNALNEALQSVDPDDPSAVFDTALAAILSAEWGATEVSVFIEGIDGIDDTGAPIRLGSARFDIGTVTKDELTELSIGAALGGLDINDPDIPEGLRSGGIDLGLTFENFPLRAILASQVGLDPTDPEQQALMGQMALGALMESSPAIRIDSLDVDTPAFGMTTRGRLAMAGLLAPEGRFELTLRGLDTMIADAQSGALGATFGPDEAAGLIFLQGLGKPAPNGPAGALFYDIEITPDMAVRVNGVDVSQFGQ